MNFPNANILFATNPNSLYILTLNKYYTGGTIEKGSDGIYIKAYDVAALEETLNNFSIRDCDKVFIEIKYIQWSRKSAIKKLVTEFKARWSIAKIIVHYKCNEECDDDTSNDYYGYCNWKLLYNM